MPLKMYSRHPRSPEPEPHHLIQFVFVYVHLQLLWKHCLEIIVALMQLYFRYQKIKSLLPYVPKWGVCSTTENLKRLSLPYLALPFAWFELESVHLKGKTDIIKYIMTFAFGFSVESKCQMHESEPKNIGQLISFFIYIYIYIYIIILYRYRVFSFRHIFTHSHTHTHTHTYIYIREKLGKKSNSIKMYRDEKNTKFFRWGFSFKKKYLETFNVFRPSSGLVSY